MKKITKLLCLLLVMMLVSGCSASNRETKEQSQSETIYDAYVYTFPLVLVNATMEKMTNTVEPPKIRVSGRSQPMTVIIF